MKQIDLLAYRNVNEAFRRRLVYHIGKDCGFFVELNFMLDAMLWCLNHRIQFQLYSEDANFGTGTGWAEYFLSFCPEVHEPFHHRYNFHKTPTWKHIIQCSIRQKKPQLLPWKLKSIVRACIARLLSFMTYHEWVFLSQDVNIAPLTRYVVPELRIDADYLEAYGMLARMIWRLQPEMLSHKAEVTKTLILPNLYSGIQIRGGDKITESTLIGGLPIMGRLQPSAGEHVFVLTDDYRLFDEISQHYPRVYLHTLCQPTERGYYHQQFSKHRQQTNVHPSSSSSFPSISCSTAAPSSVPSPQGPASSSSRPVLTTRRFLPSTAPKQSCPNVSDSQSTEEQRYHARI